MRQLMAVLSLLLFCVTASADLLDRVKLEDSIRSRVEDVVHMVDPKARVFMDVQYRSYAGTLPGTSIETPLSTSPTRIESSDIAKVVINIQTEQDTLKGSLNDWIYKLIPVEKRLVTVNYSKIEITDANKNAGNSRVSTESLTTIAKDTVNNVNRFLVYLLGAMAFCFVAVMILVNRKLVLEFRNQLSSLTKAITELSIGSSSQESYRAKEASRVTQAASGDRSSVDKMSSTSLKELLADCYWSEQDSYSAWLWKQMSNEQRSSVLKDLPFAREYSFYFLNLSAEEQIYHEHPYYLDPTVLGHVSQPDLAKEVKKEFGFWHQLSPIRQAHLPMSFQEKLSAMQSKPVKFESAKLKPSSLRTLVSKPVWGELTLQDEISLYNNPKMVPNALRSHVKSLVWLAQKDEKYVQHALSKYDARTLASVWVGPEEVLKKLEAQLPEKKLKLLETYRAKVQPSRSSEAYLKLVDEGLKDDAA